MRIRAAPWPMRPDRASETNCMPIFCNMCNQLTNYWHLIMGVFDIGQFEGGGVRKLAGIHWKN